MARGGQHRQRFVGGESLADSSEVQEHSPAGELDHRCVAVDEEVLVADAVHGGGHTRRVGQTIRSPGLAPQPHQRSDGDVEGPVRLAGDLLGASHHPVKVVADRPATDRPLGTDPHELAVRAIVTHDRLKFGDAIEGSASGAAGRRAVAGMEHHAGLHAHVDLGIFEPAQRLVG